jgi:hypothetical protein
MKHTLKTFIAEQLQEMGMENKYGEYLSEEEIIDDFDNLVKDLEQKDLSELLIEFTELEYEQSK